MVKAVMAICDACKSRAKSMKSIVKAAKVTVKASNVSAPYCQSPDQGLQGCQH